MNPKIEGPLVNEKNYVKRNTFNQKRKKSSIFDDDLKKNSSKRLEGLDSNILFKNEDCSVKNFVPLNNYTSYFFHDKNKHFESINDEITNYPDTNGNYNKLHRKRKKRTLKNNKLKTDKKHTSQKVIKEYMKIQFKRLDSKSILVIKFKPMKKRLKWKWN
jgi:hypothetical protein